MQIQHAVAWVDHREARIFLLDRRGFRTCDCLDRVAASSNLQQGRHDRRQAGRPDQSYYQEIVTALEPAAEWLIVGPSSARDELVSHIQSHDPRLTERVIGVESADHPTDREIVAHARAFCKAADRMLPREDLRER